MLQDAVQKRVQNSDKEVGCLLSGGLDSSIVAAIAARFIPKIKTFSIGFEDSPDIQAARIVAKHIKSDHHEYIIHDGPSDKSHINI